MTDDLTQLRAELRAGLDGVTPGPWQVYDGCSWRRIGTAHGRRDDCAVLAPTKASDGHPDLTCSRGNDRDANLAHIARCSPENIAALLDALDALRAERDEAHAKWEIIATALAEAEREGEHRGMRRAAEIARQQAKKEAFNGAAASLEIAAAILSAPEEAP